MSAAGRRSAAARERERPELGERLAKEECRDQKSGNAGTKMDSKSRSRRSKTGIGFESWRRSGTAKKRGPWKNGDGNTR
jgi:hypothetical protein